MENELPIPDFAKLKELRERAAIAAMQGILANPAERYDMNKKEICKAAVDCADALLLELEKQK